MKFLLRLYSFYVNEIYFLKVHVQYNAKQSCHLGSFGPSGKCRKKCAIISIIIFLYIMMIIWPDERLLLFK